MIAQKLPKCRDPFERLMMNVRMSSDAGAAGYRTDKNPKLSGRQRKGNQSTKRHAVGISTDDLCRQYVKQNGICFWLQIPMELDDIFEPYSPFAMSVDRIDNTKDYFADNIVICHRLVNKGRSNYNDRKFAARIQQLRDMGYLVNHANAASWWPKQIERLETMGYGYLL